MLFILTTTIICVIIQLNKVMTISLFYNIFTNGNAKAAGAQASAVFAYKALFSHRENADFFIKNCLLSAKYIDKTLATKYYYNVF